MTSISWAFLTAGASGVIASQWSVPDKATKELFTNFYQLRKHGESAISQKLMDAINRVRQQKAYTRLPYFWAAFQHVGLPI